VTLSDEEERFAVRQASDGRFMLSGALSFLNARSALRSLAGIIRDGKGVLLFDLQEITRADSAGLALLIEALRLAGREGVRLELDNLPGQVEALASVSGVEAMLPRREWAD
jgi:phospholipid transport system transporter-binding protein